MTFEQLNNKIQAQFTEMCKTGKLFRVNITGDNLWGLYITGFKEGQDIVFRCPESTTHTCNNDKHFIRKYGNIVAIQDNQLITMFDIDVVGSIYEDTITRLSTEIKKAKIVDVFYETYNGLVTMPYEKSSKTQDLYQLGHKITYKQYNDEEVAKYGVVNNRDIYTFHHFHTYLPKSFVKFGNDSIEAITGELRTTHQLFLKGLAIPLDTLITIRDLMVQGSLLRADLYKSKVDEFIKIKQQYEESSNKELWAWSKFQDIPFARFANELIGTTCIELAEGKDINKVCQDFNKRIDPINFMKATAPITQRQIDEAAKRIQELGYEESFNRRFATIDDIDISEILHCNLAKEIKTAGLFDKVKPSASTRHKRAEFDTVEEVSIDKFMLDILPNVSAIELFLENRFENNLVTMTTSNSKDCKQLFKWNNPFSWTYNGNIAAKSNIKENVKAVGGKITGILRCSLQWNDEDTKGIVDLDLHCNTPFTEIYYSHKKDSISGGWLDVDMINPQSIGIENITWQNKLRDGKYKFFVRNFSGHTRHNGFKVEIEFDGNTYNYSYLSSFQKDIMVASITVSNGEMSIEHHLPETNLSKDLWNLETNKFHKVNLVCLSPNYWGNNNIGNKHYFFMLDNCHSNQPMRSFHIENLNSELLENRKVLEVLGEVNKLEPSSSQLAGLGFNNTDELIVKLSGSFKRVIKIKFN